MASKRRCDKCGEKNSASRRTCRSCGEKISRPASLHKMFGVMVIGAVVVLYLMVTFGQGFLAGMNSGGGAFDGQTVKVRGSQFAYASFEVHRAAQIKVEANVNEGVPIQVRLLNDRHFEVMQRGGLSVAVTPIEPINVAGVSESYDSGWASLNPGTYHLIINLDGRPSSSSKSEVFYKISIQ